MDNRRPYSNRVVFGRPGVPRSMVRGWVAALFASAIALGPGSSAAWAQQQAPQLAQPVDVTRESKDGVRLAGTYFAGTNGRDSVPVILLHGQNGSRKEMIPLAQYLQKTHGDSVVAVDLRGYGESTGTKDPKKRLLADSMPLAEYQNMVTQDLEAWKAFLVEKNNDAECNIDKLSIVASDMSCIVAMLFTARDWSWPPLVTGKQGQDVKVVALISPDFTFKGLNIGVAAQQPDVRSVVSLYFVVGKDDPKSLAEATRVEQLFTRTREKSPTDPANLTFYFEKPATRLQGTKLLNEPSLGIIQERIGQWIELRTKKDGGVWKDRSSPTG